VAEIRECVQCGTPFTPGREHARICSARCRMAWNRDHAGVAAAPAVAIDWSVAAMTESAARLEFARDWDLPRVAVAVAEAVWWVTLAPAAGAGTGHPCGPGPALGAQPVQLLPGATGRAPITKTFARCASFLAMAAALAGTGQ
jgi:hypothetical protein